MDIESVYFVTIHFIWKIICLIILYWKINFLVLKLSFNSLSYDLIWDMWDGSKNDFQILSTYKNQYRNQSKIKLSNDTNIQFYRVH